MEGGGFFVVLLFWSCLLPCVHIFLHKQKSYPPFHHSISCSRNTPCTVPGNVGRSNPASSQGTGGVVVRPHQFLTPFRCSVPKAGGDMARFQLLRSALASCDLVLVGSGRPVWCRVSVGNMPCCWSIVWRLAQSLPAGLASHNAYSSFAFAPSLFFTLIQTRYCVRRRKDVGRRPTSKWPETEPDSSSPPHLFLIPCQTSLFLRNGFSLRCDSLRLVIDQPLYDDFRTSSPPPPIRVQWRLCLCCVCRARP